MIKIKPDKEGFLTQWDIDRKVVISGHDGIEGVKVHFASPDDDHGAYVVEPVEQDGTVYADIPNILLTEPGRVDVFVYTTYTRVRAALMVFPREKPDDYVYTETEVLKYEDFVERLDGLEKQAEGVNKQVGEIKIQLEGKEDTANRVTTVDENSDDEHYPTAKAAYNAMPKKLSDLENDLFYNRQIEFLKLTEKNFVWDEDSGFFVYVGSPRLGWLKSADNVDIEITATFDGQTNSASTLDGTLEKVYDDDGETQYVGAEPIEIVDNYDCLNDTVSDNFSILVMIPFESLTFNLTIYRSESKKIPIEYCDTSEIEAEIDNLTSEVESL